MEPRWNPRGIQDEPKRESRRSKKNDKKNEVNLGRVSESPGRVEVDFRQFVTRPLGE